MVMSRTIAVYDIVNLLYRKELENAQKKQANEKLNSRIMV